MATSGEKTWPAGKTDGRDWRRNRWPLTSRLEAALAVTRLADPDRAVIGQERLGRRAVARLARPARRRLAVLVAQVLGQLGCRPRAPPMTTSRHSRSSEPRRTET